MNKSQKVLFVVLAIIGVLLTLHINDALAAESTKPLKCTYPEMTLGKFEVPGEGGGTILVLPETTITVLEKTTSMIMKDRKLVPTEVYRFDASYDKPVIVYACPQHGLEGPWPYAFYSQLIPPAGLEQFFLPVAKGICK